MKLAENALKTLDIDCAKNGQNPFSNATIISGHPGQPTNRRPQSLFNNLEIFCTENNNGLQECTFDFISHFFDQNSGFSMQNLTGDDDAHIFQASGQFNLNKLDQLCNSSYASASACITKNKLQQTCPDATFVKAFNGVLAPVCDPESRKRNGASIECLEELQNSQNFSHTVQTCLQSTPRGPSRQPQQQEESFIQAVLESMDDMCGSMRRYFKCSKKPIIDYCGPEAFDFIFEINQNAIALFDPSCNVTENHKNATLMEHAVAFPIEPHELLGNASVSQFTTTCPAAAGCMRHFEESQGNITSLIRLDPGSLVPRISREQFLGLCQLSDQLIICFDANDVFNKCENDTMFETLNTAVFAMCEDSHRQGKITKV